MSDKKKNDQIVAVLPYIIFGIFFIMLCIQYSKVDIYYDDFGYYALTHGTTKPYYGTQHSFAEIFSYLGEHYRHANGRLLYALMWLVIYKFGGLTAVRLSGAIIVTAIWIVIYRIINDGKLYPVAISIILCLCFMLFGISLHGKATYWFAAFYTYYTPLIPLGLFSLMYKKNHDKMSWGMAVVMYILLFLASWGGESLSCAIVVSIVCLIAYDWWKTSRLDIKKVLFIPPALAGLLILVLSPGIRERGAAFAWEGTLIGHYIANAVSTFSFFFSEWNHDYVLYMLFGAMIVSLALYVKRGVLADLIGAIGIGVIAIAIFVDPRLIGEVLLARGLMLSIATMGIITVFLAIPVGRYYYYRGDIARNIMLGTSFLSVVALMASPDRSYRIFIPFCVCGMIVIVDACGELWQMINEKTGVLAMMSGLILVANLLCMVVFGSINAWTIYKGYSDNHPINLYNDAVYRKAKADLDSGQDVRQIHLMMLKDEKYAGAVVYQENWFKPYIDHYYELPDEVEYVFDVPNEQVQ